MIEEVFAEDALDAEAGSLKVLEVVDEGLLAGEGMAAGFDGLEVRGGGGGCEAGAGNFDLALSGQVKS